MPNIYYAILTNKFPYDKLNLKRENINFMSQYVEKILKTTVTILFKKTYSFLAPRSYFIIVNFIYLADVIKTASSQIHTYN